MSYILDALKKAEAERHLGDVPSIPAGPPPTAAELDTPPFWRKHLPWLLTGLLALIMLAYVLWSRPWTHGEATPAITVQAPTPIAPPPVAATPAPQPAPLPQAVPGVQPPSVPTHPAPVVTTEKPAHVSPPAPAVTEKPKAEDTKPAVPAVAATPAAPEEEVGTMQDLPASIQRELPQVTVNGYIYARNPADRSALINKKLLHEGENVAPDLILEKLTPKGAVLNYKGYRYRVSY